MLVQLIEHIFNYSLAEVATVFYNRYPNSFSKHIVSEDVLWRQITDDQIVTRKLIVKKGSSFLKKVPRWISGQTNVQFMPTVEDSIFCRLTNKLVTRTWNISATELFRMSEECSYLELDTSRTAVMRNLKVIAHTRFHTLVEKFLMMTFRKALAKTVKGYDEKLAERFGPPNSQAAAVGGLSGHVKEEWKKKKREKLRLEKDAV